MSQKSLRWGWRVGVSAMIVVAFAWAWSRFERGRVKDVGSGAGMTEARAPFEVTYLDAAAGRLDSRVRSRCVECHAAGDDLDEDRQRGLRRLEESGRDLWFRDAGVAGVCGGCHAVPDPSNLARGSWVGVVQRMSEIMAVRGVAQPSSETIGNVLHYYLAFSRETLPKLPRTEWGWSTRLESGSNGSGRSGVEPAEGRAPLGGLAGDIRWEMQALGEAMRAGAGERPRIGHVESAVLEGDGAAGILVSDTGGSEVGWIERVGGTWIERRLARVPHPARAHAMGMAMRRGERRYADIVVACLGTMESKDDPLGRVILLRRDGVGRYEERVLVEGLSRVVDAQPGDLDGDGDEDVAVASFGFLKQGGVGWLENLGELRFVYRTILNKTGAEQIELADVDGDGRLDLVVLFGQEHEEVRALMNEGGGRFRDVLLFRASAPSFGMSGMQVVDLDGDGDLDVLFTNGDNLDQATVVPRPYHGVQWLENQGGLRFQWHDILRSYGAYCARAADMNGDGRLDVVLTMLFQDWSDTTRPSLMWLENQGAMRYRAHPIAVAPSHLISATVMDMDGDGRLDVVAGGMHGFPPYDRLGRVTLWKNRGRGGEKTGGR